MRQIRFLILAMFAILAVGAVGAASASAEGDGPPAILILEGDISALTFLGEGMGERSVLSVLGNVKSLEDEGEVEGKKTGPVKVHVKNCLPLGGTNKKDTNLCEGLLTFTGVHIVGTTTNCTSETLAKVKDAVGTVLVKLDVHLADEKSTTGVLQPLVVSKVLSVDGTSPLEITCGVVKVRVSGRIGCLLLPGLTETEVAEILCKTVKGMPGDQETGTCEETPTLCKELKEDPFLGGFTETEKVDAAFLTHILGTFNKPVFIDD